MRLTRKCLGCGCPSSGERCLACSHAHRREAVTAKLGPIGGHATFSAWNRAFPRSKPPLPPKAKRGIVAAAIERMKAMAL